MRPRPGNAAMLAPSWNPTTLEDGWITRTEPTPDSLWEAISGRLREVLSETTYDTWLAHAEPRSLGDGRLVVAVPNEFTRDWIESHFRGFVSAAARESSGRDHLRRLLRRRRSRSDSRSRSVSARRRGSDRAAAELQAGDSSGRRAQPEVHVRHVHHRLVEPLRARGGTRGCGGAGTGVQPALHLRLDRPREDPPPAGDRPLRQPALAAAHAALRDERDVHERLHRLAPGQAHRGLQAQVPQLRRPPDRRHPVLRGEGADPGGVLPHLQLALRGRRADHHLVRSAASRDRDARGAASLPLRVGSPHGHPAARTSRRGSRSCARRSTRSGSPSPTPRC